MDDRGAKENGQFFAAALRELGEVPAGARVLDVGCGTGDLVAHLRGEGFDAWGCDNAEYVTEYRGGERLLEIARSPYRLPAEDGSFDAVISSQVLEHAQNKDVLYREIHRVLRPGGVTLHAFPPKYYLPIEPHIFVPLVNWTWPSVPKWWLALWAMLGVRNQFQGGYSWRQTVADNIRYCKIGLSYWPHRKHKRVLEAIFGNCTFPNEYGVRHAYGGAARLARALPLPRALTGWVMSRTRMALLIARKAT